MLTTEEQDAILKRARALARCHLDVKRRLIEPVWAADTKRRIHAMGIWPKGLPVPDD